MAEILKMTEAELDAVRLNALLNGNDLSSLSYDEEDDDFEIEIVDDTKENKKKTRTKKNSTVDKPKRPEVPVLEQYSNLIREAKLNVTFNEHDIHYKEQLWPVPSRTVMYNIELVTNPKIARDISDIFNNESAKERELATSGKTRYYKIVTYENVLYKFNTIGNIKVYTNSSGKVVMTPKLFEEMLSTNNVNVDKVKKNISAVIKAMQQ